MSTMPEPVVPSQPALGLADYLAAMVPVRPRAAEPPEAAGGTFRYTLNGRSALYLLLRGLDLGPRDEVLVPAFICESVVQGVAAAGALPVPYDVGPDGQVDVAGLADQVGPGTRAVITVHYFGFPQDVEGLVRLLRPRGVLVVEDCAHAWLSSVGGRAVGTLGDAAIYSIRKFLPMIDGGGIRLADTIRNSVSLSSTVRPSVLRWARIHKETLEQLALLREGAGGRYARALVHGLSRVARRTLVRRTDGNLGVQSRSGDGFQFGWADWGLGALRTRITEVVDRAAIIARRRSRYLRLHAAIGRLPHVRPLRGALPEGVCPWGYPIVPERRAEFDVQLRRLGIQAFTFGDPLGPLGTDDAFPRAAWLRERVVLLPCHQSLTDDQIDQMIDAVARVNQ